LKSCKFDEDTVKISWEQNWEQQKSNAPTLPQKEKNLGLPGACCLTHIIGSKKDFAERRSFPLLAYTK
jgi:hypothetical protein